MFVFVTRTIKPEMVCKDINDITTVGIFDTNDTVSTIAPNIITTILPLDSDLTTIPAVFLNISKVADNLTSTTVANDIIENQDEGGDDEEEFTCPEGQVAQEPDVCWANTYDTAWKQGRMLAEVVLVIYSIGYLVVAVREWSFLGRKIFMENMALCPSRVCFLIGCILLVVSVPFRLTCQAAVEDNLAVLVMIFTSGYALFFCR